MTFLEVRLKSDNSVTLLNIKKIKRVIGYIDNGCELVTNEHNYRIKNDYESIVGKLQDMQEML